MLNKEDLKQYVKNTYDAFHAIPEKGMEEFKTAALISEKLKSYGYEVTGNIGGKTGVIGTLDTGIPGPVVGLRSDMDALEYVIDGKVEMRHTCGHDAHIAMLLTAGKAIMESKIVKKGVLKLVFQPAEEKFTGALSMINAGALDGIEYMFGMHIRPIDDMPDGMATPDLWYSATGLATYKIRGRTAHGSRPHQGVNVVDISTAITNAINAIREKPSVAHSIKVTNLSVGGDAYNIIPDELFMAVDIRSQNNEVLDSIHHKLQLIFDHITAAYGGSYEKLGENGAPASEYDSKLIEVTTNAVNNVLGKEKNFGTLLSPGGEDFHYIPKMLPCKTAFMGLGVGAAPAVHHKDMALNKETLISGVELWIDVTKQMFA